MSTEIAAGDDNGDCMSDVEDVSHGGCHYFGRDVVVILRNVRRCDRVHSDMVCHFSRLPFVGELT